MLTVIYCSVLCKPIFYTFTVFLYGHASTQDHRKTVPQIRSGEYESLEEKVNIYNAPLFIYNGTSVCILVTMLSMNWLIPKKFQF